jgi:hypothetical protein
MISQEIVPDVYVFTSGMLIGVVSNLYDTLIITYEKDMVHSITIVLKSLSHPK